MSSGRHHKPTASGTGRGAAALATTGAFAVVPFALSTGEAEAAEAPAPAVAPAPTVDWTPIVHCESGGNPHATNSESTASGLFQFIDGSWKAYGGGKFAKRAKDATPAQQLQVAEAAFKQSGLTPWAASKHCWGGKVNTKARPTAPGVIAASTSAPKTSAPKTSAPKHRAPATPAIPAPRPAPDDVRLVADTKPAPAAPAGPTTEYTVTSGDSLSSIARSRGLDWHAVWTENQAEVPRADLIRPGQRLRLPGGGSAAPATTAARAAAPAPAAPAPAASRVSAAPAPAASPAPAAPGPVSAAAAPAARPVPASASAGRHRLAEDRKPEQAALGQAASRPAAAHRAAPPATGPQRQQKIWLTGYSYQDNTPAGSAEVSHPILHKDAGGTGTFADPITVAVPGQGEGIYKAGSRFYLPSVKRYVIAEDTGASPAPSGQDGHLDMWIGGQGGTKSATDACMDKITGTGVQAVFNPPSNLPVMQGPIWDKTCNIPGGASADAR